MESLYAQFSEEFEKGTVELLIVDNASGDGSVGVLDKQIKERGYKHVHLIPHSENSGFGAGCNLGAASAKGKYLLFLNNDTLVQDKGIFAMAEYMNEHLEVQIMGGQMHNPDGSLQPSAGEFYTPLYATALLLGLQKYGFVDKNPKNISQVSWVKGGLFMIQSDVFKKLRGFDERIFMYTEDMELCYRAKLAGYKTYFYPHIQVQHAEQGSSSRGFAIVNIYKNLLYFYKKHRSRNEYLFVKSLLTTKAALLIALGKVTRRKYLVETYRDALSKIK